MKKISIELQSDTCFASGELYNSSIDTDICYDEYGLPFISAKRIKGCLRESALELMDFGLADFQELQVDVEDVFGKAGKQEAVFSLQNARLDKYAEYVNELTTCTRSEYKTQQAVLNQFTYIRQQTSIEKTTGTAEETTLRSIRVINKGLVFEALIEIPDKYDALFEKICKNVKFMGLNRTRGMGEVRLSYIKDVCEPNYFSNKTENVLWNDKEEYYKLSYNIRLESPMILKSVAGGQSKTIPYIEGSKILGMIAQSMKGKQNFLEWMQDGELICSNAYISDEKTRYLPVSASLYHVKNQKNALRDKTYKDAVQKGNQEGVQLCQLNNYYVSSDTEQDISKLSVKTELHYHHTRPQDKSKGHVIGDSNSEENGKLFYMESIAQGQMFSGYILGSKKQLRYIYDFLKKNPFQKIGFSKNVEYGQVFVSVCGLDKRTNKKETKLSEFIVKLNAPTILYNENGMYSTDEKVLLAYIEEKLGQKNLEIINRFLTYDTIGGYQTTWEAHKPMIAVLDKGTTVVLKTKDGTKIDVSNLQGAYLGERIQEGYGEVSVYALPNTYERSFIERQKMPINKNTKPVCENILISKIALTKAKEYIQFYARKEAKKIEADSRLKAVNANLLLMCEQQESFAQFERNILERYKENTMLKTEKLRLARKIIPEHFKISDIMEDVLKKYPEAKDLLDENMVYKVYVRSLLLAVKYAIRGEEVQNGK